jgi:phage-related protein
MANFPILKSGQVAQYPLRRSYKQNVDTVSFLDGGEQRAAITRQLREWTIQYEPIDEAELSTIEAFVEQQQGSYGTFVFTDPVDGSVYNNCSLNLDVLDETLTGLGRIRTKLVVRENPD